MSDLSVKETAAALGVGVSWLYERAARSEVPHQRYGRTIRFTESQVETIRQQYAQPVVSSRRLRNLGRAS